MQGEEKTAKKPAQSRDSYHHGDLRANLVEATRRLVEEKGPDRFSVSDACRAAGVSTAAPYRHFSDREEMLVAVAFEGMERFHDRMKAAVTPHRRGSLEAIVALGLSYIGFAEAEPGVFRLIFGLSRTEQDNEELTARGMRNYGILLDQVAAFYGKTEVDEEVLQRGFSLWTMVHGLSFLRIDEKATQMKMRVDPERFIAANTKRLLAD